MFRPKPDRPDRPLRHCINFEFDERSSGIMLEMRRARFGSGPRTGTTSWAADLNMYRFGRKRSLSRCRKEIKQLTWAVKFLDQPRRLKQVCMKCFCAVGKNRKFSRKQWTHHVHVLPSSPFVAALILSERTPTFSWPWYISNALNLTVAYFECSY